MQQIPLDTWNQSGLQENVFGNHFSTFDSPKDHPQRIPSAAPLDLQPKVKTSLTSEDGHNYNTTPMPMFASRPLTASSEHPVVIPQNYVVGQQRQQIPELQFDKFPNPQSFLVWKIRFKTQVTACSGFPSDAMLWIKDVEMVGSLDELKSSRSVYGNNFPIEMLDAKIASALNKIIQNSQFKKKVSLEEQKAQKEDRFLRGRQIAVMIYDYFRETGAHDTALDYADLFSVTLHDDNTQEFGTRWDEVLLSMSKIPSDDILESLYKLRIRESAQLKTVLELSDMWIHQKISVPNNQKLKTMVKRCIDQKPRLRNFDAWHKRSSGQESKEINRR